MNASINYDRCGSINTCKVNLFNNVIQSIRTYQTNQFDLRLRFNNDIEIITQSVLCSFSILSATSDSNAERCSNSKKYDLFETSIEELQNGLEKNHFTSVDLVKTYIARIEEVNFKGPKLRAVLEISPTALQAANESDILRQKGIVRSRLHGIPILLKDNIATRHEDGMNTTAGSYALVGSIPPSDATVVKKLREAGAIILGKTTLSEWANFRSDSMTNGWTGRNGQATSAFYPQGDACGSSTGSGIAMSIGLAAGTLGTETDGSIICPSDRNNVVGIKPTVGLTSRNLVIPISHNQDTVGPMCRSVADAAAILSIIAGRDTADNYTFLQSAIVPDYTQHLKKDGLKGARIGVMRKFFLDPEFSEYPEYIAAEFNKTVEEIFKPLGAEIIDPANLDTVEQIMNLTNELTVLLHDFKHGINSYLSQLTSIPTNVTNLQDLIDYNFNHSSQELPPKRDDQNVFLLAQNTTNLSDPSYITALNLTKSLGGNLGIDATLKKYNLDALITLSVAYATSPAALAGYPMITVPLGFLPNTTEVTTTNETFPFELPIWPAPNFPFGISFIGTAYSEAKLIELAYSYEQATLNRRKSKPFNEAIPKTQLSDVVCQT